MKLHSWSSFGSLNVFGGPDVNSMTGSMNVVQSRTLVQIKHGVHQGFAKWGSSLSGGRGLKSLGFPGVFDTDTWTTPQEQYWGISVMVDDHDRHDINYTGFDCQAFFNLWISKSVLQTAWTTPLNSSYELQLQSVWPFFWLLSDCGSGLSPLRECVHPTATDLPNCRSRASPAGGASRSAVSLHTDNCGGRKIRWPDIVVNVH